MAIIKNGLLQDARGSMGNTYFRMQNGKLVLCAKPASYNKSMEKRPAAIRAMMQMLTKTGGRLMKDKFFYNLWKIEEIKGLGPYHKFVSKNHFGKKETLSPGEMKLSPYDDAFTVEAESFSITEGSISVTLKPLGAASGINTFREPLILSRGILIASDAIYSVKEVFIFEHLETDAVPTDLETPMQLNYKFIAPPIWGQFSNITALLILATLNSQDMVARTSVTLSGSVVTEG